MATYADIAAAEAARVATTIQYWVGETEGDSVTIDGVVYALTGHGSRGFVFRTIKARDDDDYMYHAFTNASVHTITVSEVAEIDRYGLLVQTGTSAIFAEIGMGLGKEIEIYNNTAEVITLNFIEDDESIDDVGSSVEIASWQRLMLKKVSAGGWTEAWRSYTAKGVLQLVSSLQDQIDAIGSSAVNTDLSLAPADGTEITGTTLTVTWTPRAGEKYDIRVGSAMDGIQHGSVQDSISGSEAFTVPEDGSSVYLRFDVVSIGASSQEIVSTVHRIYSTVGVFSHDILPADESTITTSSATFTWQNIPGYVYGARVGPTLESVDTGVGAQGSGALAENVSSFLATDLIDGTIHFRLVFRPSTGTSEDNEYIYNTYTVAQEVSGGGGPVDTTDYERQRSLVESPWKMGFGAAATGGGIGSPVVQVTSLADSGPGSFRSAVAVPNRWVTFHPDMDGEVIHLLSPVSIAGSLTVDGRDALPYFAPDPTRPRLTMFQCGASNNIIHRMFWGHQTDKRGSTSDFTGFRIGTGQDYWIDHCESKFLDDDPLGVGHGGSNNAINVTITHYKVYQSNKGLLITSDTLSEQNSGRVGRVTVAWSDLAANYRNFRASGSRFVHGFNNYIHGYGSDTSGCVAAHGNAANRNGPDGSIILVESCVFEDSNIGLAGFSDNVATTPPFTVLSYAFTDGANIFLGGSSAGTRVYNPGDTYPSGIPVPNPSYAYSKMAASSVKAYVLANAGVAGANIPFLPGA